MNKNKIIKYVWHKYITYYIGIYLRRLNIYCYIYNLTFRKNTIIAQLNLLAQFKIKENGKFNKNVFSYIVTLQYKIFKNIKK